MKISKGRTFFFVIGMLVMFGVGAFVGAFFVMDIEYASTGRRVLFKKELASDLHITVSSDHQGNLFVKARSHVLPSSWTIIFKDYSGSNQILDVIGDIPNGISIRTSWDELYIPIPRYTRGSN
jgi:hypothetical protein